MTCEDKKAYRSHAKAHQAFVRVNAGAKEHGHKAPTHVYQCPICSLWHLTTTPQRTR